MKIGRKERKQILRLPFRKVSASLRKKRGAEKLKKLEGKNETENNGREIKVTHTKKLEDLLPKRNKRGERK